MTIFTVNTAGDVANPGDGKLTLREAVASANATTAADTIVFAPGLEGKTLTLKQGELTLNQDTTIDGDQNNDGVTVTLSGGGVDRILRFNGPEVDAVVRDLSFRDGFVGGEFSSDSGGAILSEGSNLKVYNSEFTNNLAGYFFESSEGGAIASEDGSLLIQNSSFVANGANFGGAIAADGNMTIRGSIFLENASDGAGAILSRGGFVLEDSVVSGNNVSYPGEQGAAGGGIAVYDGSTVIARSTISNNYSDGFGGGIHSFRGQLTIVDSTIANNVASYYYGGDGGGIRALNSNLIIRNSTITGNIAAASVEYEAFGGGIAVSGFDPGTASLDIANCIVSGNSTEGAIAVGPDIGGTITRSNGHNVFGSNVLGNVAGDRENIAASTIFAVVDQDTGGGLLDGAGIVPLKANSANPALGGADRFLISSTDQLGNARPNPTGTNPDSGAAEKAFAHSTASSADNDTLTGTAAANTLSGLAGADFLKSLGGNDTLNGGAGGDFLEGGAGNDKLNGNAGIDIANYGDGYAAVTVDLRGALDTDTAKRGSETDTLTGIEGAIAGGGNDRFFGDGGANWFQGGQGKDTFTSAGGRDLYDYNLASATPVGSGRDVITDFAHLTDDIDLMGIDANSTVAGNQSFIWVGTAALGGPGEVGFFPAGGNTIVRGSTDADAASEFEIQLTGSKALTALDFYL